MSWPNFTREEFACRCGCGKNEIHDKTIDLVQSIRTAVGEPLSITSGYRCPNHPIEAKKATPGTHAQGLAADIGVSHGTARKVLEVALSLPQTQGIGVNQKGNGRFIHVDIGPARNELIWTY